MEKSPRDYSRKSVLLSCMSVRGSARRRILCFFISCVVIEAGLRYFQHENLHVWGLPLRLVRYLRLYEPCYPPGQDERVSRLRGMLFDFVDVAESLRMRYWLEFGALLGAVRNGKIIPWDWDLDVGVMKTDMESEQFQSGLKKKGFKLIRKTGCKFYIYRDHNTTFLDVYMHLIRKEDDIAIRCEIEDVYRYKFPAKWISPTAPIMFEGRMLQAPNPPMAMVKEVRYPYSYFWTVPQNFYCYFTEFRFFLMLLGFVAIIIMPIICCVYYACKHL
ncbi:uncharacterized protein RP689-like [Corticium candelabrum]|uniref:uncharacterized protein RP689-like n=1 Tax=Corticium candelabrum TaxID=121492 RepID=UPI002E35EEE1|nr:uncharacterized protein RP689-like [Corticium candelabrum]